MSVWHNGELVDEPIAIDHHDRGWTLGDGLFETLRSQGGRLPFLSAHLKRLRESSALLRLPLPWNDSELAEGFRQVLRANGTPDAVLRLTVSRGPTPERGLPLPSSPSPTVVIASYAFSGYSSELYGRGMRLVTCSIRRNPSSPLSRVKSISYLDNVLARDEARRLGADEGLMLNTKELVACATAANAFAVVEGSIVTPPLAAGILPGVTRALVLRTLAPDLGIPVVERSVSPAELVECSELFLTNSLIGVMPATLLDGRPVGSGRPGAITTALAAAWERLWNAEVAQPPSDLCPL